VGYGHDELPNQPLQTDVTLAYARGHAAERQGVSYRMSLTVPPELVVQSGDLKAAFHQVARAAGIPAITSAALFSRLPAPLCDAPAFLCAMGGMWRYQFGLLLDGLPEDSVALGTRQCPEVSWLLKGLLVASERLTQDEISLVSRSLGSIDRHLETLTELAPLARISTRYRAEYEPPDCGTGNRRIDWRFTTECGPTILLEVKSRVKDLIEHLSDISHAAVRGAKEAPEPTSDPAMLFRDTVEKFREADPAYFLQGAWIYTAIKQEVSVLRRFFDSLDHSRIHFAVLGDWDDDAFVMTAPDVSRDEILRAFSLRESERFVFRTGES